MEKAFNDMDSLHELDLNEILNNMIDGTKDVDLKTQILKPKQLASLKILSDFLSSNNLTLSDNIIKEFLEIYFRYMFSFERQSRKEIIRAISYQMEIRAKNLVNKITEKVP